MKKDRGYKYKPAGKNTGKKDRPRRGPNYDNYDVNELYDLYLKSENNRLAVRAAGGGLKAVMVFPNYYEVAMSNLGFLRAYELINLSGTATGDRAFLQDDLSGGIISIESRKRLINYDLIFFSLSYENDFINILRILDAENIPFLSAERNESFPLVMAGGVIAFLNPEPVAPLFDIMFIGEAEAILPDFLKNAAGYGGGRNIKNGKKGFIETAGKNIGGIYAPCAYDFIFDAEKPAAVKKILVRPGFPEKVKKMGAPAGSAFSYSPITTKFAELSGVSMMEIERGCKRGCRFCSAGYIYLPLREPSTADILKAVESLGENEKAGFVGLGTMDSKNIGKIMGFSLNSKKSFSLSSVRFDCLDENNLGMISEAGIKTVTLGIETGSARLKKLINKDIGNAEIIAVLKNIIGKGIMNIKAYFRFGLPFEENSDLNETIELFKNIREQFIASSRANKTIGSLTASFGPFVPKAWTPLQWENFEDTAVLKRKAGYILSALKNLPNLNVRISSADAAWTEAFFARGSRLSLKILIHAYKNGISLKKAITACGYGVNDFIRKPELDELLPWDIIDQGVTKKYLAGEYERGVKFKTTPQCFEGCKRCGVCK